MIPVRPPMVNVRKKAKTKSTGVAIRSFPLQIVAIQQNICTAVGITIIREAAVKKLWPNCGRPVANMWCTHTLKLRKPVMTSVLTIGV